MLPVDTKSEARMLLQTPLAVHFSALPPGSPFSHLAYFVEGFGASPELGVISIAVPGHNLFK